MSIKLIEIKRLESTRRFQSQLCTEKDCADFVIDEDGIKHWRYGESGVGFYPYNGEYVIVDNIEYQNL